MKLFLLKNKAPVEYDSYSGHVVRAKDELTARLLCPTGDEGVDFWKRKETSSCEILAGNVRGKACILLSSFHAG